jgi:putative tryptophan/tyrosine transport system substrate-binding protein
MIMRSYSKYNRASGREHDTLRTSLNTPTPRRGRVAALARDDGDASPRPAIRWNQRLPYLALLALITSVTPLFSGVSLATQRILVVASSENAQFLQALQGVRDAAGGLQVQSMTLGITSESGVRSALQQSGRDTAVVAFGARAGALVATAMPPSPITACLMLSTDPLSRFSNVQSVPIDLPVDQQVMWLKRLLPQAHNIGILYDPDEDATLVEPLAAALRRAGFTPALDAVKTPVALPAALERLSSSVDALLAVPDAKVYNAQTSKGLLLFSFRYRLPLIGLSEAWVKAGALYALDWDYREAGGYCGQVAIRQLPGSHGVLPIPPRPRVIVNMRTAALLNARWNDELRASFDHTYE